jgi:hypothetical protein
MSTALSFSILMVTMLIALLINTTKLIVSSLFLIINKTGSILGLVILDRPHVEI